jgi:hypothetical protein
MNNKLLLLLVLLQNLILCTANTNIETKIIDSNEKLQNSHKEIDSFRVSEQTNKDFNKIISYIHSIETTEWYIKQLKKREDKYTKERFTKIIKDTDEEIQKIYGKIKTKLRTINPNIRDGDGNTLLHKVGNDVIIIQMLLDRGADINAKGFGNGTPLHNAVSLNLPENQKNLAVEYLLKNKANPNAQDADNATPLHYAASRCTEHNKIIEPLIQYKAIINIHGWNKNTPLHLAAIYNNIFAIKILLQNGADSRLRNKKGETAFDLAPSNEAKALLTLR